MKKLALSILDINEHALPKNVYIQHVHDLQHVNIPVDCTIGNLRDALLKKHEGQEEEIITAIHDSINYNLDQEVNPGVTEDSRIISDDDENENNCEHYVVNYNLHYVEVSDAEA